MTFGENYQNNNLFQYVPIESYDNVYLYYTSLIKYYLLL